LFNDTGKAILSLASYESTDQGDYSGAGFRRGGTHQFRVRMVAAITYLGKVTNV
jgi:hypothetical protein